MIVTVKLDADDAHGREYFVPEEWREVVYAMLRNVDTQTRIVNGKLVQPRLRDRGSKPIAAIKVLRQFYGLNLKDAKAMSDRAPCALPGLPRETALKLVNALLVEGGATAELPSAVEQLGELARNQNAVNAALSALNGE